MKLSAPFILLCKLADAYGGWPANPQVGDVVRTLTMPRGVCDAMKRANVVKYGCRELIFAGCGSPRHDDPSGCTPTIDNRCGYFDDYATPSQKVKTAEECARACEAAGAPYTRADMMGINWWPSVVRCDCFYEKFLQPVHTVLPSSNGCQGGHQIFCYDKDFGCGPALFATSTPPPSEKPTSAQTKEPSPIPSQEPSSSLSPTHKGPSSSPSGFPSSFPSLSSIPSAQPSLLPTLSPSAQPSFIPTRMISSSVPSSSLAPSIDQVDYEFVDRGFCGDNAKQPFTMVLSPYLNFTGGTHIQARDYCINWCGEYTPAEFRGLNVFQNNPILQCLCLFEMPGPADLIKDFPYNYTNPSDIIAYRGPGVGVISQADDYPYFNCYRYVPPPTNQPTRKPISNPPTNQPTGKPVSNPPTNQPTKSLPAPPPPVPLPPTGSPTKSLPAPPPPVPLPPTGSPTKSPVVKSATGSPVTMSPVKSPTKAPGSNGSPVTNPAPSVPSMTNSPVAKAAKKSSKTPKVGSTKSEPTTESAKSAKAISAKNAKK